MESDSLLSWNLTAEDIIVLFWLWVFYISENWNPARDISEKRIMSTLLALFQRASRKQSDIELLFENAHPYNITNQGLYMYKICKLL